MKRKLLFVLGAIALVLAVTTGALATTKYIISKSSQIKPGAISYKNLSSVAKAKLQGNPIALAQFSGAVNHGQTLCIGQWGKQGPCLGAAYASDANGLVLGAMPAGRVIGNLNVMASTAPDVGPMTITVLDNGVATALMCTIAKTMTSCSDTVDSFTTAAGDFLEVRVANDPGNTVAARFIVNFTY